MFLAILWHFKAIFAANTSMAMVFYAVAAAVIKAHQRKKKYKWRSSSSTIHRAKWRVCVLAIILLLSEVEVFENVPRRA